MNAPQSVLVNVSDPRNTVFRCASMVEFLAKVMEATSENYDADAVTVTGWMLQDIAQALTHAEGQISIRPA